MPTELPHHALISEHSNHWIVEADSIPSELTVYPQWLCWWYVDRGAGRKPDKQPVNPRTLANAGVHWANTWTSFNEAYHAYLRHRVSAFCLPVLTFVRMSAEQQLKCIPTAGMSPSPASM